MKVLLVEDNAVFAASTALILKRICPYVTVHVAKSTASAQERLTSEFYHYIILDLTLPLTDEDVDAQLDYGMQLFMDIRRSSAVPICILTGSSAEKLVSDLLKLQRVGKVWDDTDVNLILFLEKARLDELEGMLTPLIRSLERVEQVELVITDSGVVLGPADRMVFKIFTNRIECLKCTVEPITKGLTEARVFSVQCFTSAGVVRNAAIAKLGPPNLVERESRNYERFVNVGLAPSATPRRLGVVLYGVIGVGGLFYSIVGPKPKPLFYFAKEAQIEPLMAATEELLSGWASAAAEQTLTIGDIRRCFLSDADLSKLSTEFSLEWVEELEHRRLQVLWQVAHSDLHGENVLVTEPGIPMLIDFGSVNYGPAAMDPVTMELSIFFHPASPCSAPERPTHEQARNWNSLSAYAGGSAFEHFIASARHWARSHSSGDREVLSCAYGYVLRQLRYVDTDHLLALSYLEGFRLAIEATY